MTDNLPRAVEPLEGQTAGEIIDEFGINNDVEEPLAKSQQNQSQKNDKVERRMEAPDSLIGKFALVCRYSVGPIISMFFFSFLQLVNTYYIGHTNDSTLIAGVGMGNMLVNVLAFAVQWGLNGAQETLISQAFGASEEKGLAKDKREKFREGCGVIYNRGRFVVTIAMVPIIVIFATADKILIALAQDPDVSILARRYVSILIPGVWAMGQFDCSRKFLSAQMISSIPVFTQVITLALHFLWCHLFIIKMEGREVGAAIATNITYILNMAITDLWIRLQKDTTYYKMIFFYDWRTVRELGAYLRIGINGMLMLCFEWWAFELLAIFTGLLGVRDLAAEVVIINMVTFIFMLPLGISYAASALVGNFLGQKDIRQAKIFAGLTIILDIILTTIIVIIIGVKTRSLSALFTQEQGVIDIIEQTLGVLMIYIWFDTIHGVQSGIIRGLGLQTYGSIYTLVCYYLIGLPLALHFAFNKRLGIKGLWLGYTIACVILDLGFAVIILKPNWNKIAENLKKAVEKTGGISSNKVSEPASPLSYNRAGYSEAHAAREVTKMISQSNEMNEGGILFDNLNNFNQKNERLMK